MGLSNAPSYGRVASKRGSKQKKFSKSSATWKKKLSAVLAEKESALEYEDCMRTCSEK